MKTSPLRFSYTWANALPSAIVVQSVWVATLILYWLFAHSTLSVPIYFGEIAGFLLYLVLPSLALAIVAYPRRMSSFPPFLLFVLIISMLGTVYTMPLLPVFLLSILGGAAIGMVIGMFISKYLDDKSKERTALGVLAGLIVLLAVHLWYFDFWEVTLRQPGSADYLRQPILTAGQQTRRLLDAAWTDMAQQHERRAARILLRAEKIQTPPADPHAMEQIATLQIRLGNEARALAALDLEGDQRDASSKLFPARLYIALGNIPRARALAEKLSTPDRMQAHIEIAERQKEDHSVDEARLTLLEALPLISSVNPADAARESEKLALALADLGFESDAISIARSHGGYRLPYILIELGSARKTAEGAESMFAEVAQMASAETDEVKRNSIRGALYTAQMNRRMYGDARSTVLSMGNETERVHKWPMSSQERRNREWRDHALQDIERLSKADQSDRN